MLLAALSIALGAGCGAPRGIGRTEALQDLAQAARAPATLLPSPRLFLHDEMLPRIRSAARTDPRMKAAYETLLAQSRRAVGEPMPVFVPDHEPLLATARQVLGRITTLALIYRLSGEATFAEQARAEMLAVAAFPEWTVDRFLPAAELTAAMGIGYDWLFDFLDAHDRAVIRAAIIRNGLRPALRAYAADGGWARSDNNHNLVGNGGVIVGALAIADDEPELARRIIDRSRRSIRRALRGYAPDGGWPEGPIYWLYATRYATFYQAALRDALGSDLSLMHAPGFPETGFFRIHGTGPTRLTFNFGDSTDALHPAPFMYWLARALDQPLFAAHERWATRQQAPSPWELIWAADAPGAEDDFEQLAPKRLPTAALFRGVECAFFRGAWDDPNTTYVALKGGENPGGGTHQHLDLGSFMIDALGQRWALDLGPDDYGLSRYFGRRRWDYYRISTEGHNTLLIDGRNQRLGERARIVAFHAGADRAYAVVDLSSAYHLRGGRIRRGVALLDGRDVLVQDEIDSPRPASIRWSFHTPAQVRVRGSQAILRQNGQALRAQILQPHGAQFRVLAGDRPGAGEPRDVRNLVIELPRARGRTRIAVLLTPGEASPAAPRLRPLDQWIAEGGL